MSMLWKKAEKTYQLYNKFMSCVLEREGWFIRWKQEDSGRSQDRDQVPGSQAEPSHTETTAAGKLGSRICYGI